MNDLGSEGPVEFREHDLTIVPPLDDRRGLAIAGGLVAAVLGGLIWAGVVLYWNLEVGWVAWGVGILVGAAMAGITLERSRSLGVWAAGIAVVGLLVGKFLITVGSTGALADDLFDDGQYLRGAVAWDMYMAEELSPGIQDELRETLAAGDTLSDELWERMLAEAEPKYASMSEGERRALARSEAGRLIGQLGWVEGILIQLGPWDLLWFGLAVVTAFQMVGGVRVEESGSGD
jgi:hypothetical protein